MIRGLFKYECIFARRIRLFIGFIEILIMFPEKYSPETDETERIQSLKAFHSITSYTLEFAEQRCLL
jgi:hypothetical protein